LQETRAVLAICNLKSEKADSNLTPSQIVEGVGESLGEPDTLVERAEGEQPGVAGELAG
jgi:hypothetical protein